MSNEITQADRELLKSCMDNPPARICSELVPAVVALRAIAAARRQAEEAQQVCGEAYQVVGCLLSDTGQFDTEHGQNVLDNLSQHKMVHDNVLPWDSKPCVPSGGEATPIAWRTVYPDGSHSAWSDGKGHWPETAGFAGGAHGWEYAFAPPSAPVGVGLPPYRQPADPYTTAIPDEYARGWNDCRAAVASTLAQQSAAQQEGAP